MNLIEEAFKAHQMGDFTVKPNRLVGRPRSYKDKGCDKAKENHGYFGKCIDCPLPECLET